MEEEIKNEKKQNTKRGGGDIKKLVKKNSIWKILLTNLKHNSI